MNIVWVSPWMPGPMRPRSAGLLRAMAQRGHRIAVVGLDVHEPRVSLPSAVTLHPVPVRPVMSRVRAASAAVCGTSLTVAWGAEPRWELAVRNLLVEGTWDLVHCEHVRGTAALPVSLPLPLVWDAVDSVSDLYLRLARRAHNPCARLWRMREASAIAEREQYWLRNADAVVCTTTQEAQLLRERVPELQPVVVPNGVDVGVDANRRMRRGSAEIGGAGNTGVVQNFPHRRGDWDLGVGPVTVCSGKWRHPPNREAVDWVLESIWPKIRQSVPRAQLWIVGADPPPRWKRLDRSHRVLVLEDVPDMVDVLGQADVALCAMVTTAGVQNKVLEAMAAGLPVVCTAGAAQGVSGARACGAVVVADSADDLARETVFLLNHPETARDRGDAARAWAGRECRWDRSGETLESVWRGVLG